LGGEPYVACFDIVLSSHRIASLRAIGSIHGPRRSVLLVKRASCLFVPARPQKDLNTLRRRGLAEIMGRPPHYIL
jgi:hypothetical protein